MSFQAMPERLVGYLISKVNDWDIIRANFDYFNAQSPLSNMSAAVAPDANDDTGSGYGVGSRWFDTTADRAYVCLDATAAAAVWFEIASDKPGDLKDIAGTTVPSGWLLCDGDAVSRTTYAALFAEIGTAWGVGDGSTTFNVPFSNGRVRAGLDNMGGTPANVVTDAAADSVGGVMGAENQTLAKANLASHDHVERAVSAAPATGVIDMTLPGTVSGSTSSIDRDIRLGPSGGPLTTATSGNGDPFSIMQPTMFINMIIKT